MTMRGTELSNSCMDSTAMFNYAFENFTKTEVNGGYVFLPKGVELNSLTEKSENTNGKTETGYYLGDYLIGTASVAQATDTPVPEPTAAEDSQEADISGSEASTEAVKEDGSKTTEKSTAGEDTSEKKSIPALRKILLMLMAVMILILISLLAALRIKEKKHHK